MKFSEQWLRQRVNVEVDTAVLSEKMTLAGLEVDSIEPVAKDFQQVVVGQVLTVEKHPDADKLKVCQVNVGAAEPLQIVCGASNVTPEMKVPTALVGAKIGDLSIKQTKLRGIESSGMLCSAVELGLAESSQGLYELSQDAPIGVDIRQYLQLDDQRIDLELTPNRGDCLSVEGIAREVAVLCDIDYQPLAIDAVPATIDDQFPVDVIAADACPRYLCRIIRNINAEASTPLWMQERLRRSGIRSIDPVVDVTNYVMIELGQPMHGFDLEQCQGGIVVRYARPNEKITLLDESEQQLDEQTLLIADEQHPLAMGGVMGAEHSGINANTQHILLESAYFKPENIALTSQRYNIYTDSSHRFARGVDHQLQQQAMERATALLLEIVGGDAGPITSVAAAEELPTVPTITLRQKRVSRILGISIDEGEIQHILQQLGMDVVQEGDAWSVKPPSYRFDVQREEDLVEEIGRVYGYDKIPYGESPLWPKIRSLPETYIEEATLRDLLVHRDYREVITYSFVDTNIQQWLTPKSEALSLINPISADMSAMRTTLWTGLLQTALYNLKRQQSRLRLFETGLCFTQEGHKIQQQPWIAGLVTGTALPQQWAVNDRPVDYYDIKGDVEALLNLTRKPAAQYTWEHSQHPALHPGQGADIAYDGQVIGHVGLLHPEIKQKLGIKEKIFLFALQMQAVEHTEIPKFATLSKYPTIGRDIAIVVDEKVTAAAVQEVVAEVAADWLQALTVFDVYHSDQLAVGQKSLGLGLVLQHQERTLEDGEVNELMARLLEALEQSTGAELRE